MLATTVLRRASKQWRLLSHHAVRVWSTPFTGNALDSVFTRQDAARRSEVVQQLASADQVRAAAEKAGMYTQHVRNLSATALLSVHTLFA